MNTNKMIRAYEILAVLLIVLGIVHCVMVFVYFDSLTGEAIFSLGTGISVSFLGLMNFSAAKLLIPMLLTVAVVANAIQTSYGVISLLVISDLQAYVGVFIFLVTLITSWIVRTRINSN